MPARRSPSAFPTSRFFRSGRKEILDALGEAAMDGGVLIAAEFGKGFERLALFRIEPGGDLDFELHMKIPFPMTLKVRHSMPLDPEVASSLRACRNLQLDRS